MAEIKLKVVPDTSQIQSELKDIERQIKGFSRSKVKLETEKGKLSQAKKELDDINKKIQELNSKRLNLQANEQAFQKITKEINSITNKIKELNAKKLEMKADGLNTKKISAEIDKLKAKKLRLEIEKSGLQSAHQELVNLDKELSKLQNKKAKLETQLENGEKVEKELTEVNKELNELNGKKAEMTLQLNGLEQLKSNIKSAQSTIKSFGKNMETVGNGMLNMFSINSHTPIGKFAHFITKGIGYSTLYRGVTAGMNAFNESLSGSVERFDAIRRGVNVMKQLRDETGANFSDESINNLIEGLSENILGLPTGLNDAISHTKDLVSVTGDLERSKDIYTALNDAVLSFGGTEENVERVMSQFIVSLGRGKVDGRAFRSMLQNGMTPALNEMAKSLGLANAGELQEALKDGEVSAEQFTDALIDLDKNGSAGMNSLREMVYESVDTFQGAFSLLKMRLTAGMTDILTAINDTFGEMFGTNLIDSVKNFGTGIRESLQGVAEWIKQHKDEIKSVLETIAQKFQEVMDIVSQFNLGSFIDGLTMAMPIIETVIDTLKLFAGAFKGVLEIIGGGDVSKGLGRFIVGWYSFGFALKGVGKMLQLVSGPLGTLIGTLQTFGRLPALSGNSFLGKLFSGKAFKPQVGGDATKGGDLFGTENMVASLKKTIANLVKVGALCLELVMVAKTIKTVDKELEGIDWQGFAGKLLGMGVVVSAVATFSTGLGAILNKVKIFKVDGIKAMATGLLSIVGSGGALWVMAKAMQELNDLDVENWGSKLAYVGTAILEINAFAGILGGLDIATAGLTALAKGAGAVDIAIVAGLIVGMAKALQELDKVEITKGQSVKKLEMIQSVLDQMTKMSFEFSAKSPGNTENIKQTLKDLVSMAKDISKLSSTEINTDGVTEKITKLGTVIDTLNDNFGVDATSGWKTLNVSNIESAVESIKQLIKLPTKLQEFSTKMEEVGGQLNGDTISGYAENLSQTLGKISVAMTTTSFTDFATKVAKASEVNTGLDNLKEMGTKLVEFQTNFPNSQIRDIQTTISNLKTVLQAFKDNEIVEKADYLSKASNKLSTTKTAISNLKTIVDELKNVQNLFTGKDAVKFDKATFEGYIEQVRTALESVNSLVVTGGVLSQLTSADTEGMVDFETVANQMANLKTMVTTLGEIGTLFSGTEETSAIDLTGLQEQFKSLGTALEELPTTEDLKIDEIVDFTALSEKISTMSTDLSNVVTQLNNVGALTLNEGIGEKIKQIRKAIDDLASAFTEPANAHGAMSAVSNASGGTITQGITTMVNSIKSAVDTLNSIEFTQTGTDFAQQIVDGFTGVDVGKAMVETVNSALKKISGLTGKFGTLGRTFAQTLANGFRSNLNGMQQAVVSSAMNLGSAGGAFRSAGVSLGNQLVQGIQSQLNRGVTVQVTASTHMSGGGAITPEGVEAFNAGIRQTIWDAIYNSNGGKVQYLSRGGMLAYFEPKGVDVVPAMLQPGEFVMRKRVVDKYGQQFFNHLNNGDLSSALRTVTNRDMATTTQSITYNTINNNNSVYTDNRSVKVYGSSERSQRLKAGRFLRGLA